MLNKETYDTPLYPYESEGFSFDDDFDPFRASIPRRCSSPHRAVRRRKKSHRFRNFLLLLAGMYAGLLIIQFNLGEPLGVKALISAAGLYKGTHGELDLSNVQVDYLIDMNSLDEQLSSVSNGYFPSDEDWAYFEQTRAAHPALAEKLDLLARHIDSFSQTALRTVYLSPEKTDFVLQYPLHVGEDTGWNGELKVKKGEIPFLVQYDTRWGNHIYGSGGMGNTACGPTCLSMVASGLTGDGSLTPPYISDFAWQNGYYIDGTGTSWALFTQGAASLGLRSWEIPVSKESIRSALEHGAVICSVSAGDFTLSGHFIVIRGSSDDGFSVCDPSSIERSEKLWSASELLPQVAAAWAFSA